MLIIFFSSIINSPLILIPFPFMALLASLFDEEIFLLLDFKNMGRSYYNQPFKKFCSTVQLNQIEGFEGKHITVYLPAPGGRIPNSIKYVKYDYLLRL